MSIVYRNFRTTINASTLVASESISALGEYMNSKASVFELGQGSKDENILDKIDYQKGKTYRDTIDKK